MPAPRPTAPLARPACAGVSMRDLLASCAAADAVSRPPRAPEAARPGTPAGRHREAAQGRSR
ncbi:hypothetical protein QQY24_12435 [Streptomyces sp. TG1A-8]|uniref:hypothetical protein n=1 Tax=Streptomyces sp. TG1A-8 TaxID=3051385 RepID=UPI00265C832B|nr:hypothetical protein [Streptomyces sp. TG1A-8]MDO0926194.1 hypothetical protein [Streptomyces sp. TG1A-8]